MEYVYIVAVTIPGKKTNQIFRFEIEEDQLAFIGDIIEKGYSWIKAKVEKGTKGWCELIQPYLIIARPAGNRAHFIQIFGRGDFEELP